MYVCKDKKCGDSYKANYVSEKGHVYGADYKCEVCGAEHPAVSHGAKGFYVSMRDSVMNANSYFVTVNDITFAEIMEENGGNLELLFRSNITELPEGLTVGGSLDLRGTGITNERKERKKVKQLQNGDYVAGRYIFCDGILTQIKKEKRLDKYTLYIGKIPGKNVVTDGVNYAHCNSLREGIADLAFKAAKDRGADQYKGVTLDTELTVPEMVTMYRVITGACRQGSESFVQSLGELKERYTVREAVELTKGQYNAERFASFFGG